MNLGEGESLEKLGLLEMKDGLIRTLCQRWQTFSVKGQIIKILAALGLCSQLLNSLV